MLPPLNERVLIAWSPDAKPRIIRVASQIGKIECHVVNTQVLPPVDPDGLPAEEWLLADWAASAPDIRFYPLHAFTALFKAGLEKETLSLDYLKLISEEMKSKAVDRVVNRADRFARRLRIKKQRKAKVKEPVVRPIPTELLAIPCDRNGKPLRQLSQDDLNALVDRYQNCNDLAARNTALLGNTKLAYRFVLKKGNKKHDEDFKQEAITGLSKAIEKFDTARGLRFSTYATHWLKANVIRYMNKQVLEESAPMPGSKVIESAGVTPKDRLAHKSIYAAVEHENNGVEELLDTLVDAESVQHSETFHSSKQVNRMLELITQVLDKMDDPRMRIIVERRLLADDPESLEELGARLSLSRERVRVLINKLNNNIRNAFALEM